MLGPEPSLSESEPSLSAIVLRTATVGDADALSRFAARVFVQTFAATASAADIEAYLLESYSPAIQAGEIGDSRAVLFLAEDRTASGDNLVGYAHLVDEEASSIELKRIYVDAVWQGRGLARRLLEQVMKEAGIRGARRLWLSVWHRNDRAIAFYTKNGFRISGEMRFDWGDDIEVGFVMEIGLDALGKPMLGSRP